jgi:hypothetical protein
VGARRADAGRRAPPAPPTRPPDQQAGRPADSDRPRTARRGLKEPRHDRHRPTPTDLPHRPDPDPRRRPLRALHPRRARGADRRPRPVAAPAAGQPRVRARPVGLDAGPRQSSDLARQAVDEALARLDPEDRFSVVVYDDQVDVVAPSHRASEKARRKASEALVSIEARGSTDLAGGWLTGCDQVAQHLVESGVNRCLLLTDGLANVGIVDPAELERHAGELRARGVATSTFGVGEDFNEALLQSMADAGGGHFYFAASVVEIRDHITGEVGETLDVVARDVTLEVTAPETVTIESMAPFRTEARGSRTLIRIGDLVSGQVVRIVLRVTFPFGEVGREIGALVGVTDRDEVFRGAEPALAPVALAWQYADHPANDAQPRDRDVDRAVAQIFAARARQEAVQLNRAGDYAAAQAALAV